MPNSNLDGFDYSGRETLADLTQANNYNSHLVSLIQAEYSDGDRVLDFGAGNGHFLGLISTKPAEFLAIEPDPKLVELISQRGVAKTTSSDDISDGSLSFIYSLNVLEHIEDDSQTLKSFWNWLEPGGGILIYVPALPHLYSKFDASIGHYRRYTKKELASKARAAGFEVERIRFMDPVGYFVALVYRLLINNGKVSSGQLVFFDRILYPISRLLTPLTANLFGKNLILSARKASTQPAT